MSIFFQTLAAAPLRVARFAVCGWVCVFGIGTSAIAADDASGKPPQPPAEGLTAAQEPTDQPEKSASAEAGEAEKSAAGEAAVARPVNPDPVRVYGWRERVRINGIEHAINAKLDTGALTSSIHAQEKELFERDGKKWVRFIVTVPVPGGDEPVRARLEAPLVRIARIKDPGGGKSSLREVVRLNFEIGERKMRGDFTLNDRSNMLNPVLIGRNTIKELGWVDSGRTHLAEEKILR